jgi:hypothetical protein
MPHSPNPTSTDLPAPLRLSNLDLIDANRAQSHSAIGVLARMFQNSDGLGKPSGMADPTGARLGGSMRIPDDSNDARGRGKACVTGSC